MEKQIRKMIRQILIKEEMQTPREALLNDEVKSENKEVEKEKNDKEQKQKKLR